MTQLYIGPIRPHRVGEGPGLRTTIWVSGCSLQCVGCHNPELWPRASGQLVPVDEILSAALTSGDGRVSLVGGEPLDQPDGVAALCKALRDHNIHIIVYTGYVYERLLDKLAATPAIEQVLATADVLVDGPYIAALNDPNLQFRGSRNQRVIDLVQTRLQRRLCLLDWDTVVRIVIRRGQVQIPVCDVTQPILHGLTGSVIAVETCGRLPASVNTDETGS